MATHNYIIHAENKIVDARATIQDVIEAFALECTYNTTKDEVGGPNHENYDLWATLSLNVNMCQRKLNEFLELVRRRINYVRKPEQE